MLNSLSSVICVLIALILQGNKFYVAWEKKLHYINIIRMI
jgi:hypothetical protein